MAIIQEMLNKNHSEFGTGTDERGKAKYSANSKDGIFYLLDENDIPKDQEAINIDNRFAYYVDDEEELQLPANQLLSLFL